MKKHLSVLQNESVMAFVQIVVGCVLGGLAFPLFLVPNSIAPGGLTGLATILHHLFDTPVGTTSLLMNVPLFIISYKTLGGGFAFRSLIATLLFSLSIDFIPVSAVTNDPLLASVFGGVLVGFGLGLILRGGATTGGTDMVARMIHERFPHITVGMFLLFIDCLVVLLAGFFIEIEYALYAFICLYVASKVIDVIMMGFTKEKACYIITANTEEIKSTIMHTMDRGLTVLSAEGGYSGQKRPVLLCVISAQEVGRMKAIVRSIDQNAFMFISDAHEVLGEGFQKLLKDS